MTSVVDHLKETEESIMSGLKDFQQATVRRIDELYRRGQMRILVSDEVGLGKTLIARGTIAKFARMRKEQNDDLVKVVYVCSNAAIADQNLSKLWINQSINNETTNSSRLSMQHLNIFKQESAATPSSSNAYIQLIPLTPDTSFRMTLGAGKAEERALMFALLKRLPEIKPHLRALEILMKYKTTQLWTKRCKKLYENEVRVCDKKSHGKYLSYMREQIESKFMEEGSGQECHDKLFSLFEMIENNGGTCLKKNSEIRNLRTEVIKRLRIMFAEISLEKLEPDLVIMDEFQRFKYLINVKEDSDIGLLAGKFFNSEKVRMLLLSATPYKMYSTMEEIDQTNTDEHFTEFFNVMDFLNVKEEDEKSFMMSGIIIPFN